MEMLPRIVVVFLVMTVIFGMQEVMSKEVSLCNMSENDLLACKPAVSKQNPADPSPACCKALSSADLSCLCSYKNSILLPSLGINPDFAMQLPTKCNLNPPAKC
uniref:Bifunctional inhibitor/plant lipid transfer protein/seed storage helical domain-containing protein n=1 Tax=Nelumbo nucifera TaxID=4432 RepID=A0A822ZB68_NELNU|nr:TPA_asm: hypothetical protein HUJ06_001734 [Nelumbo nucifera]